MSENPSDNEESLREEFETLGRNLVGAMRAAWDAPESKRLRDEVVGGLNELGTTLRREVDNLSTSQTAQQVKSGVEQVGEKIRSTDAPSKVRSELVNALQMMNSELQKLIERWAEKPAEATPEASAAVYDAAEDASAASSPPVETGSTQADDPGI